MNRIPNLRTGRWAAVAFAIFAVSACSKIPQESAALSTEIGKRIEVSQTSHLALVRRYFDAQRERVNAFTETEWIPLFVAASFKKPAIANAVKVMAETRDGQVRLDIMTRLSTIMQKQIAEKRKELTDPINRMERSLTEALRVHYAEMTAANAALTGLLVSVNDVADARRTILRSFGVEKSVTQALGKADAVVDTLLGAKNAFVSGADAYKTFRESVKTSVADFETSLENLRQPAPKPEG